MAGYSPAKSRLVRAAAPAAAATPRAHSDGKEAPHSPSDSNTSWKIASTRIPQVPSAPALTLAAVAEEPLPADIAPSAAPQG